MPPEAKLRMRNVGKYANTGSCIHTLLLYYYNNHTLYHPRYSMLNDRDTPTSSGPNSFYKGKMGFSDPRAGYKRYNDED